ncbi:MAG: polysaccharide deacetylase family protein [Clostridia bacterium]
MKIKRAVLFVVVIIICGIISMPGGKQLENHFVLDEPFCVFAQKKDVEVTHLFTHCLVAYPEIAFAKNNEMRLNYDKDCLTVNEFKAILNSLYERGFVLVSPSDVYEVKNNVAAKKTLNLNGKKPLILSFDDVNYYTKKMNLGMNDKLIVSNGRLATYTANAKNKVNFDNDVVTILENFVEKHPDFSFNNAKGTICLTGFDGILGYRTNRDSENRAAEIEKAKIVVDELKRRNWTFACHSYGHYHMKKLSDSRFSLDTDRWINEVENLIGKTDIYVYPYGESEIDKNGYITPKHKDLVSRGFKFFWGVGDSPFYGKVPFDKTIVKKYLFMDRIPLDGYSLKNIDLSKYFDVKSILDKEIRPK